MITKHDYQKALDSQSACNLPALVKAWAEVQTRIAEECHSTYGRNIHPINRLYLEQALYLCVMQNKNIEILASALSPMVSTYTGAYNVVCKKIEEFSDA